MPRCRPRRRQVGDRHCTISTDSSPELRECLRFTSTTPNTTTLGRPLARLDGNALDDAIGAWLGRYATDPVHE
ncbi:hypothetical protein ACFC18_45490, partial [Streptomyces sp. NPDC056121]|uniref:hypothetical protein n=1 Tax=Streptomyces sp. NPDC056121 TaxID=3345718 RepID=UPI0035D7BB2A